MLTIAGLAGAVTQAARRLVRRRVVRPVVAHPETNGLGVGPVDPVVHRFAQFLTALRAALGRSPVADTDEVQAADHVSMSLRRIVGHRFCGRNRILQHPLSDAPQTGDTQDPAELRRRPGQNCRRPKERGARDRTGAVADHPQHVVVEVADLGAVPVRARDVQRFRSVTAFAMSAEAPAAHSACRNDQPPAQ